MDWLNQDKEENWISISDLMTGLMVIFLFIAVAYIYESQKKQVDLALITKRLGVDNEDINQAILEVEAITTALRTNRDSINQIIAEFRDSKRTIYLALESAFQKDFRQWGAEIDSTTLTIRFNGEQTKFAPSSDRIPKGFRNVLDQFIPKYLDIVTDKKFADDIVEIKIEGHAAQSSQSFTTIFKGSQTRARNVLLYLRDHPAFENLPEQVQADLGFKLTATGMGYSRMIDDRGDFVHISKATPCADCSRRVEFTILTANERVIEKVGQNLSR